MIRGKDTVSILESVKPADKTNEDIDLEYIKRHLERQNERIGGLLNNVNKLKETGKELSDKGTLLKVKSGPFKKLATDCIETPANPKPKVNMQELRMKSRSIKQALESTSNDNIELS